MTSNETAEADEAHSQHKERQQCRAILAQSRDAFEEHSVGNGAGCTLAGTYHEVPASVVDLDRVVAPQPTGLTGDA